MILKLGVCFSADVLSEDTILKWYNGAHSAKGKSVFLEQIRKFVTWLQNAEEEGKVLFKICGSTYTGNRQTS